MNALLNRLHRLLARWRPALMLALKLRNQCAAVIGYRLAATTDPDLNGERWLLRQVAARARTFVDVGAHRGEWTQRVLEHAEGEPRGLLFEPNPECLPALRSRFERRRTLEVCPLALGAEAGERPFKLDGERSHLAAASHGTTIPVAVSTLDREVAARQWQEVDLLKIDAEGYDLQVLRGAAGLLSGRRIGIVQFEYGDQWPHAGSTLAAALQLLTESGYEAYLLRPDGLEAVCYERWGEYFTYSNYIAVAPHWRPRVESCIRR